MIPVLAVPVLLPGKVDILLASIDEPVERLLVIDNGAGVEPEGAFTIHLPANLGVAAAWNLAIRCTPHAPWWAIVNDDVRFAPGDLARLAHAMESEAPLVAALHGFSAFGINAQAVEQVGFFDENYHPAYVEDCDYEYRCKMAEVEIRRLSSDLEHDRSWSMRNGYEDANCRTYPENVRYHQAKWGGAPRSGERHRTPFDRGGSVRDWTLDLSRLRELAWSRVGDHGAGAVRVGGPR